VTLRQGFAATGEDDSAAGAAVGDAFVALQEWTFILGPNFTVGLGNGLILGYLMYRSGLVPRAMAMLGLVGGPLICAAGTALIFGVIEQGSPWQMIPGIPEFFWELSLGVYLIVRASSPLPSRSAHPLPPERGTVRRSGATSWPDPPHCRPLISSATVAPCA
jgi:hypothetical protein